LTYVKTCRCADAIVHGRTPEADDVELLDAPSKKLIRPSMDGNHAANPMNLGVLDGYWRVKSPNFTGFTWAAFTPKFTRATAPGALGRCGVG